MKTYIILTTFVAATFSLAAQGKLNPEQHECNWYNAQKLERVEQQGTSNFHMERKSGSNWVFEYTHKVAEYAEVADDEKTTTLSFEFSPNRSGKFMLKNEELSAANAYFMLGCFCANRGFHKVNKGTISGTRLTRDTWLIKIDVEIDTKRGDGNPDRVNIKRRFKLKRA
jgi:hypothetical protein